MKVFKPLYERALRWAAHPQAAWFLALLSFVEAIIFPVAPEIMLAPMVLAKPERWARYATISLVCSMLGALVGYALGHYAFDAMRPLFEHLGWMRQHRQTGRPSCAAISPSIRGRRSGCSSPPASCRFRSRYSPGHPASSACRCCRSSRAWSLGRGKRVFIVAGVIRLGGSRAEAALHRWIEPIGWEQCRADRRTLHLL